MNDLEEVKQLYGSDSDASAQPPKKRVKKTLTPEEKQAREDKHITLIQQVSKCEEDLDDQLFSALTSAAKEFYTIYNKFSMDKKRKLYKKQLQGILRSHVQLLEAVDKCTQAYTKCTEHCNSHAYGTAAPVDDDDLDGASDE